VCLHFTCSSVLTDIYKKILELNNRVSEVFRLSVNLTALLIL
jgi:hypothetical protein